jgi:hypothetical protein
MYLQKSLQTEPYRGFNFSSTGEIRDLRYGDKVEHSDIELKYEVSGSIRQRGRC